MKAAGGNDESMLAQIAFLHPLILDPSALLF
jgi:hypothetical protein